MTLSKKWTEGGLDYDAWVEVLLTAGLFCGTADHRKTHATGTTITDNTSPITVLAQQYVHWPGRPILMCNPCAANAVRVAKVMGFDLHCEPARQYAMRLANDMRVREAANRLGVEEKK